ncbi:hypothetical protein HRbin23_00950 [bacterium HR23]|nr:hypothetical protein HRbin23_00950 [bacterium HR23]
MPYLRTQPSAPTTAPERENAPRSHEEGRWTTEGLREPRDGYPRRNRLPEDSPDANGKNFYSHPDPRPILTPLRRGEVGSDLYPSAQQPSWSWERWGQRSENLLARVARDLEMFHWGAIGLLVGLVVAGVPAFDFGFDRYPFVVAQPLGALVGALIGSGLVWLRWQGKGNGS